MKTTEDGHVITDYWCKSCSTVPVTKDGLTCSECWERAYNRRKHYEHGANYRQPMSKLVRLSPPLDAGL